MDNTLSVPDTDGSPHQPGGREEQERHLASWAAASKELPARLPARSWLASCASKYSRAHARTSAGERSCSADRLQPQSAGSGDTGLESTLINHHQPQAWDGAHRTQSMLSTASVQ